MAKMTVGPGGIEILSGALKKAKKRNGHKCGQYVIATHRVAATTNPNCQHFYVKGADAYTRSTPVKSTELAARSRFTAVAAMVKARKNDLMNISTDQANFEAQKNLAGGKTTMKAYLWKICGDEYDAQH